MGRLPRRHGSIDWPRRAPPPPRRSTRSASHVDSRARVGTLSIEMQQEVEVARAVSADSRVLVLDEATSSLSEAATQRLLERLELLRARGVAIVFISHRLREMYQCCSRVDSSPRRPADRHAPLPGTDEHALVADDGRTRDHRPLQASARSSTARRCSRSSGVTTRDGTVQDATFEVRAGEIVGVAGLVGCGKSELALALAGVDPADGEIRVHAEPVDHALAALRDGRRHRVHSGGSQAQLDLPDALGAAQPLGRVGGPARTPRHDQRGPERRWRT